MIESGKLVGGAGLALITAGASGYLTGHIMRGLIVAGVGVVLLIVGVVMVSRKNASKSKFDRTKLQFNDGPVPDNGGLFEVFDSHAIEVGNVTGAHKGNKVLSSVHSHDIKIGDVKFRECNEPNLGEKQA